MGIVSPSKLSHYSVSMVMIEKEKDRKKADQFFAQIGAYNEYIWAQRVAARKVTKEEWLQHYRTERTEAWLAAARAKEESDNVY